ncbi:amidase [Rhodanobacter sp. Col0626]|uniref:amidase n=1 Tax=Rhodanobacter sp. Col0626 TaxID=3415679 RepID=UPI003CF7CB89
MDQHDLGELSAAATARLVKTGEVRPTEVVDAAIARIEARNPSLNALVYTDFEHARQAARNLERRMSAGEDVGALAAVPTAMKDLFGEYPDWPSTMGGIPALRNHRAKATSLYPERMQRAGAIMIGTTNSPALGFRGTCDNDLFGPTRNPFDMAFNSGGSSGGSAAVVADGILPVAGANDGGGSAGIAAAWCGVYGFQPSHGLIPRSGGAHDIGHLSPYTNDSLLSRTVEDAALVLDALAHQGQASAAGDAASMNWLAQTGRSIAGMKIGLWMNLGVFPVDSRIAELIKHAAIVFEGLGADVKVIDFTLPQSQQELSAIWCRLMGSRMLATAEGFRAAGIDLLGDDNPLPVPVRTWIERARGMSLAEMHAAEAARTSIRQTFDAAFGQVDLILAPTVGSFPVRNAARGQTFGPDDVEAEAVDPLIGWALSYLINFTGHPVAFVPAGAWDDVPVGMQLIGRPGGDGDVLAASAAFELAQPWASRYRIPRRRPLDQTHA